MEHEKNKKNFFDKYNKFWYKKFWSYFFKSITSCGLIFFLNIVNCGCGLKFSQVSQVLVLFL